MKKYMPLIIIGGLVVLGIAGWYAMRFTSLFAAGGGGCESCTPSLSKEPSSITPVGVKK